MAQQNSNLEELLSTEPDQVIVIVEQRLQSGKTLTTADRAYYQRLLSDAHYSLYQAGQALENALVAVQLAEDDKQSELYQRALLSKAFALGLTSRAKESLAIAQDVLVWSRKNNNLAVEVNALLCIGFNALSLVDYTLALDAMQQGYALTQKHPDSGLPDPARFASYLAQVYGFRNEPDRSLPLFLEAAKYCRENGFELELSDALYGAARAHRQLEEPQQALSLFKESMALSLKHDDVQGWAYTVIEVANLKLLYPELTETTLEQTITNLLKAREMFTQVGNGYLILEVEQMLADIYLHTGEFDKGLEVLKNAKALITSDTLRRSAPSLLRLEARILSAKGENTLAYERLLEAYKVLETVLTDSREEAFERLRGEFNLEQQETKNKLLSKQNALQQSRLDLAGKQNTIVMLITLLLTVVIGCMVFFYRNLRIQKDHLARIASQDPLTGMDNRRAILLYLETAKQSEQGVVCIALLDLDNFKQINDKHGHQSGDEVLMIAAQVAKSMLSQHCRIGRIGGEEFLMVFNPSISLEKCRAFLISYMQQVRHETIRMASIQQTPVTFSIGLTKVDSNEHISTTLARADKLMYLAKEQGKDKVVDDIN
ncbi:MAG: GGDEF domain-containing protein [Alteromonadaceae bacterium]|nr:GGDEF domain-containing protein [Alteromonadaceae bacterium]